MGRSEAEGTPSIVEAVRVGQANVAAGRAVLCVPRLHPEDVLRDTGLGGDGEPAHAAAEAGERGGVDPDHAEGRDDHGGDTSR